MICISPLLLAGCGLKKQRCKNPPLIAEIFRTKGKNLEKVVMVMVMVILLIIVRMMVGVLFFL